MSNETSAPLPQFSPEARVYHRDESDVYMSKVYQYASSSHNSMMPAAVIYPANIDDITLAVQYARDNDIGIAVRTGGHQYSGASSTSGDNIQLDISHTFRSEDDFSYDPSTKLLHSGVSFPLVEMNTRLRNKGLFLPHGQCVQVHVGGHILTGGYSMLSRAFGMLIDHLHGFDIVLASGEHKTIWKPNSNHVPTHGRKEEKQFNDDLYWAVIGGSPGNYGVLTHIWICPLHDKDYPDSRGLKLLTLYSEEKMQKILTVIAEMNDDKDLPADFDVCFSLSSNAFKMDLRKLFLLDPNYKNKDEEMMQKFPEEHGYVGGLPQTGGQMGMPPITLPTILIYIQWANVNGTNEKFGDKERIWFDRIIKAAWPSILDKEFETMGGSPLAPIMQLLKFMMIGGVPDVWLYVSHEEHTPISKLMRYWCYEERREFIKPFVKSTYVSNKHDLSTNGWVEWVSRQINEIVIGEDKDIDTIVQIQPYGGNNSRFRLNGRPEMHNGSHSWRDEFTMIQALDIFYQPKDEDENCDERLQKAKEWQRKNDASAQKGGIFCEEDRRVFWASYSRETDGDGGDLHAVRSKYYDSEEKYNKLVEIKRRVDPDYVFTANLFGIDANNAPENRQIRIVKR